jgi:glycosyltransferase involved in cell wall biosynthesis
MRIVVCDNQVPFIRGGGERLRAGLVGALSRAGHEVDLCTIPYRWYPPEQIPRHMLAARLLDVSSFMGDCIDRAICLRFPAYLVRHPDKVLWLMHQHRTAYELWDTPYGDLNGANGAAVRAAVHEADQRVLPEARRIHAISRTVAERLRRFHGIGASVLHPPLPGAERFRPGALGNYVFYASRLDGLKRHTLLIDAMAQVTTDVHCVFSGGGEQAAALRAQIDGLGLGERVSLLGHVDDETVACLYRDCLAVAYVPYEEDFGYGVLEAFHCAKPVITLTDSGGPLELVADERNGLVVAPDAAALAAAIDRLRRDSDLAVELGRAGHRDVERFAPSWSTVVEALTQ